MLGTLINSEVKISDYVWGQNLKNRVSHGEILLFTGKFPWTRRADWPFPYPWGSLRPSTPGCYPSRLKEPLRPVGPMGQRPFGIKGHHHAHPVPVSLEQGGKMGTPASNMTFS
jgi:hypothetical protein